MEKACEAAVKKIKDDSAKRMEEEVAKLQANVEMKKADEEREVPLKVPQSHPGPSPNPAFIAVSGQEQRTMVVDLDGDGKADIIAVDTDGDGVADTTFSL